MSWWRRQPRGKQRRPLRQSWDRNPTPTDALTGYAPGGSGLIDDRIPGQVFADEIDPAWADVDSATAAGEPGERAEPQDERPER